MLPITEARSWRPEEGFGLKLTEEGSTTLKIKRLNIAERLYRTIGGGTYRDSVLTGHPVPIKHPLLNAKVLGSDSVVNAIFQGKLYWFWGDTNRPGYPLGNFHVPMAISELPGKGGLDPNVGVDLDKAVAAKYGDGCPGCGEVPCVCSQAEKP